jgi:exopolysaccharide biosynthesis protein
VHRKPLAIVAMTASLVVLSPLPTALADEPDRSLATSDSTAHPTEAMAARAAAEPRIETAERERPIAPGVTLRSFDRYGPDGYTGTPTWLQGDSLSVDLTRGTTVDYLFPGQVAKGEPLSVQADREGAVAAVNGDFFDISNSTAPLGVGIRSGEVVQSPDSAPAWHGSAAIFTPDGIGSIGEVFFEGTVDVPGPDDLPLAGVNKPTLAAGGVEAFTPLWGTYCRCRATQGAGAVTEVEIVDNLVTAVRNQAGEGPIPANTMMLVGREDGAAALARLAVGDRVGVDYQARTETGQRIHAAINGRQLLVVNGVPQKASAGNNVPAAPRTAIGFSRDGRKMFLLTADGRQSAFAEGLGLDELATMMVELGAYHAVNLDGGGSTTMIAREPGSATGQVENRPSDGAQRRVPNGLALFAPRGSGKPRGFWVEPVLDPDRASGSSTVAPSNPERVFAGLTRRLRAAAYDETYGPARATPHWRAEPSHGTVDSDGVFHARRPGRTEVTVSDRNVRGEVDLTVLPRVSTVESTAEQVALGGQGQSAVFGVVGADAGGWRAPIEPADVHLTYDRSLLSVTAGEDGRFTATALRPTGSALVTIEVDGVTSALPVTVGLEEAVVADFSNPGDWRFFGERATGAVAPADGRDGGPGLRLTYDFTQSTGTRTGGALAPEGLTIPGQPKELRLWVNSTGKGEWASLQAWDGTGQLLPAFRAGYLTGTGWQQLTFAVPAGTTYPLTLRRFYGAETDPAKSYHGDLVIDQLTAMVPPSLDVPPERKVIDPLIVREGSVSGSRWRFAVMSDAQFVARDPDSEIVANARRTLREIRATRPDFLVINGDLVDEASAADFALAKKILDEELDGQLPYHYVPGNHERADGGLANFTAEFGETQRTFDHKGTRFVTFDTSALSYRGGDWTQLNRLRTSLEAAAADRSVRSVVVLQHVPPRDPTPSRASELSDRKEAATIEQWLTRFESRSGKEAAFVGAHVGTFHASQVDGVSYFVNGNSGKNPSTGPADGGFTGWSLWGVNQRGGLAVEVRPHVDTLAVDAPETLPVGQSTVVRANLRQDERTVPVAYPVTADWTASPSVHIGASRDVKRWHVATFDPLTGKLTALRRGTVTLEVLVNGVRQRTTVELVAAARRAA